MERVRNWVKHNKKLMNAGPMKPERMTRFAEVLKLEENYKHKNQYE